MSESINDCFESIGNWFSKKDEDERQESNDKASEMNNTASQVNGLIDDKFSAFYSLKDFLVEFWNAIQDSDDTPPDFNIVLPEFCGGKTVNVLDLSFYNNYRDYIHGIIAGICYFVYIRKIYIKIPNIIHD